MDRLFAEGVTLPRHGLDTATLHRLQCQVCPLSRITANKNPDMSATGSKTPLVYMLGEAPGKTEDLQGRQFVGDSGELLRARIPKRFKKQIRWNNVVRSRPPDNRDPTKTEIECCRPSIVKDIEETRPKAIFGFGNVPLDWVVGVSGVTLWRGRRIPVKVGSHVCWYYPMLHPSFVLRSRRNRDAGPTAITSEDERMFALDLERAFDEVEDLPKPVVHDADRAMSGITCITEFGQRGIKQIRDALRWAREQAMHGLDYETNGLRPYVEGAKILTVGVATAKEGFAFPLRHSGAEWSSSELKTIDELWREHLLDSSSRKAVHMLPFELEWSAWFYGRDVVRASRWEDTATQACILDERRGKQKPGAFSLEFLVLQYFGFNLKQLTSLDRKVLDTYPLDIVLLYNGMDAKYHAALCQKQSRRIKAEGLTGPYQLGLRRVPTVVLSQHKGVPVDQAEVKRLDRKYSRRIVNIEKKILELPDVRRFNKRRGYQFNPQSNDDVRYLLSDMLGFDECRIQDKYTKKYKYSVDENVLNKIADKHAHRLPKMLLRLRKSNKRRSTYIHPLLLGSESCVVYPDGLLHTVFNTIFAETGRLSSEDPNLQNFPKRDGEAVEVRRPLVPKKGCVILAFDYGQIEARVIAMFTGDKRFCKALWENYDVHFEWAERIAHAYPRRIGGKKMLKDKKAMKDFRTDIKNQWTFPLFFGAQLSSVASYLSIPEDVIKPHYEEFWDQFSGVKTWQEETLEFYRENGYVECLTGRRRHGPLSLNQVINSPVQGTAAEIVMDGMCRLSELDDWELQPSINIHDDLTFMDVRKDRVDHVAEQVITEMLDVPFDFINVPITVEMALGEHNWMELEEVGTFSSTEWFK